MEETFLTLTKMIKDSKNVILMTHQNMDLDGFGSLLCLADIITSMKKECYIVKAWRESNTSVQKAMKKLEEKHVFVPYLRKTAVKKIITDKTVLIVVDVHRPMMFEYKKVVDWVSKIVLIDHHIKSNDYLKKTTLNYINSNLSSTVEMMTNYLKYLNHQIDPLVATIMLTGLEIDTNNYNVKTTEKTYEAAAYLVKLGADSVVKQELLKENKDVYLKRQILLKNAYMVTPSIALCVLGNSVYGNKDLAQLSQEMLQFENVEASFTIGRLSETLVGISARSIGNIDVEKVMNLFGGGGHMTDAAAQISKKTVEEVKEELINYLK